MNILYACVDNDNFNSVIGGNVHVLSIWGEENSSPVLALHFGYSLGNVLGPLLTREFLMDHSDNNSLTMRHLDVIHPHHADSIVNLQALGVNMLERWSSQELFVDANSSTEAALDPSGANYELEPPIVVINQTESRLWIPYAISGGVGIGVSLIFFMFFCVGLPKEYWTTHRPGEEKRFLSTLSPRSCTGGNMLYGIQMFTLLFLFYVANFGKDSALLTFTLPIAIDPDLPLEFTKSNAALLITIASVCACSGRLFFAFLAKLVPIQPIVFIQIMFILVAHVILVVWGLEFMTLYWVGICLYNGFSSPLFPSVIAWADKYVKMTGVALALVNIATGVSTFIFTYCAGYVFDYKSNGAAWVMYLSMGCSVVMGLLMVAMQILGSCHGSRHSNMAVNTQDGGSSEEDERAPLLA